MVNTLEPRRSGIALPSRESEISFLVLRLSSLTDFCFSTLDFPAFLLINAVLSSLWSNHEPY